MNSSNSLSMRQAIQEIMDSVTDECVITTCGRIAREVYAVKDRPRNFYMLGSMGCALAIGLGLGYKRPDLKVIVIDGDGATLMSLGTIALQEHLKLNNVTHIILDNNAYASTGGQPTCFRSIHFNPIMTIIKRVGTFSDAPRIPLTCKEIKERFCESIRL